MSEATARTDIANTLAIFEALKDEIETASTGFLARFDTALAALQPEVAGGGTRGLEQVRSRLRDSLSPAAVAAPLAPMWAEYARQLVGTFEIPATLPARDIIDRIADHFDTNSQTVNSREFTFGSVSAGGSNVGSGTIKRLTTDRYGNDIEATWAQKVTVECIRDQSSGATEHEEVFEMRGEAAGVDALDVQGSGSRADLKAVSARDSLLLNPSFDSAAGTDATPTAITNWTIATGAIGDLELSDNADEIFRGSRGSVTPKSLRFNGNVKLTQALSLRRTNVSADRPLYACLRWNREEGSGSGATITLTLGSVTASVAVGSTTGWQTLEISLPSGWLDQWNTTDPTVAVEVSGLSSGYVLVDDVILAPYTQFDGLWYLALGGRTKFLRDDVFTFTDTGGTGGVINYWLWWTYGKYLPHATGGAETWSDPS